jgi:hypothetical protein
MNTFIHISEYRQWKIFPQKVTFKFYAGLRTPITSMRIRIPLFILNLIRIRVFNSKADPTSGSATLPCHPSQFQNIQYIHLWNTRVSDVPYLQFENRFLNLPIGSTVLV